MKKVVILAICITFLSTITVSACTLDASLINQDPYPAIPGDYVKLIFQLTGVDNPDCGRIDFELIDNYPIIFDPGDSHKVEARGGTFQRDYSSHLIIAYKVRIDEDALNGENIIEVVYGKNKGSTNSSILKSFEIEVEDSRADFELHINKYSTVSQELTIEVLNIAENDVEALTIEIPKQENVKIIGSNRAIVGDLDSSEFTTADFKADLRDGEIEIKVLYTDQIGNRRENAYNITFDSSYFSYTEGNGQIIPTSYLVMGAIVILVIIFWIWIKRKNRKDRMRGRRPHHSRI
jgi:hypothetical protein